MSLLKTHPHEFGANLLFTEHGLKPYFAFRSVISDHGGASEVVTIEHNGRTYDVSIRHQKSGLAPREEDEIQTVYEYRVHLEERGNPERNSEYENYQADWFRFRIGPPSSYTAQHVFEMSIQPPR